MARNDGIPADGVDQIFDVFVRDASRYALDLHVQPSATPTQAELALRIVRRPAYDDRRWGTARKEQVFAMRDSYRMNE